MRRVGAGLVALGLMGGALTAWPTFGQTPVPRIEAIDPDTYRMTVLMPPGSSVEDGVKLLRPAITKACPKGAGFHPEMLGAGPGGTVIATTVHCMDIPPIPVPPVQAESHSVGAVYSVGADSFQMTVPAHPQLREIIPLTADTPFFAGGAPITRDQLRPGAPVDVYYQRGRVVSVTIVQP